MYQLTDLTTTMESDKSRLSLLTQYTLNSYGIYKTSVSWAGKLNNLLLQKYMNIGMPSAKNYTNNTMLIF